MDRRRRILTRPATRGRALAGAANLAAATLALAACTPAALPPCEPPPPALVAWVVDYGWHTEVVLPAAAMTADLAPVARLFPGARTLSFGFGKQSFMTLADPGLLDFAAGTIPGPATIRIIPLPAEPAAIYRSPVTQLPLSTGEWARLQTFLWRALAHTADGALRPVPAAPGNPDPGRFYAAARGYSLAYTCNTWSMDALHQAGLPVGTAVVFAGGAMGEIAHIAAACRPNP